MSVEDPLQRVIQVEAVLAEAMNSKDPDIRRSALAARVRGLILEDRLELNDPRVHNMIEQEVVDYFTELQQEF